MQKIPCALCVNKVKIHKNILVAGLYWWTFETTRQRQELRDYRSPSAGLHCCRAPFAPARMAGVGELWRLLRTFLTLKSSCKTASLNITSDSDGDLSVTLKMSIAGQADQAPRRRGRQSSRQERGPGSQPPPPAPPALACFGKAQNQKKNKRNSLRCFLPNNKPISKRIWG